MASSTPLTRAAFLYHSMAASYDHYCQTRGLHQSVRDAGLSLMTHTSCRAYVCLSTLISDARQELKDYASVRASTLSSLKEAAFKIDEESKQNEVDLKATENYAWAMGRNFLGVDIDKIRRDFVKAALAYKPEKHEDTVLPDFFQIIPKHHVMPSNVSDIKRVFAPFIETKRNGRPALSSLRPPRFAFAAHMQRLAP